VARQTEVGLIKPVRKDPGRIEPLDRIQGDSWFENVDRLNELALKLVDEGRIEECSEVLDQASEEILNAEGVINIIERPRELCKLAILYSKIGRQGKAEKILERALQVQQLVKEEAPWKFTNNLGYMACALAEIGGDGAAVKGILHQAISSLDVIDTYYGKRRKEILAYIKRFLEDERIQHCLDLSPRAEIFIGIHSQEPPDRDELHNFLNDEKVEELNALVENDAGNEELLEVVSSINEPWIQAVSLLVCSRLFLSKSNGERALQLLDKASKKVDSVHCYWDRDRVLENISETLLAICDNRGNEHLLDRAQKITVHMKDPWKRARALCRIVETHIEKRQFEHVAYVINSIHSQLLDRIDYRDRTAMSMLLIADVFDKISEKRANNLGRDSLTIFNPFDEDRRRANKLRGDALSILDSLEHGKREESLDEYEEFISLSKKMH